MARNRNNLFTLGVATAGVLLATTGADAQSGRRMMMVDSSGEGPAFFSAPDLRGLRTPDYVRDDLPIFRERLQLDDTRYGIVQSLLERYLESFDALKVAMLPKGGPMAFHGQHAHGEHGGDPDEVAIHVLEGIDGDLADVELEMDGPGQVMVAITAGAGVGPEGEGGWIGGGETIDINVEAGGAGGETSGGIGGPEANVMIAVGGPDGEELSEEARKQLQEKAQEIAEKLQKRLEQAEANGEPLMIGGPGGPEGLDERVRRFEAMADMAKEFEAAKDVLGREFVIGVQSELTDEQLDRWPWLDRALVRKKTLPDGRLDGERTDLLAIVQTLDLDDASNAGLAEQLEAYDLTLHDALTRRNDYLESSEDKLDKAMRTRDVDKALSIVDRTTALRVGVRNVNELFTTVIAEELAPEDDVAFREQVCVESYPRVYGRPPRGLKVFEAGRQLDGLDEPTLLSILELEGPFRTELESMNEQIVQAIRKHQPGESRRGMEHMKAAMAGELIEMNWNDDPISEAYRKRRELEQRYVKQLHALLTPEQVEQLPTLPTKRRGPMIFESSTSVPN